MLGIAEYGKYFSFEERRSKGATLLIQVMAFMACAASWSFKPTQISDSGTLLIVYLIAMAASTQITYCTNNFHSGAAGRIIFSICCSQYFVLISSDSVNAIFWHISIGSAILIAMAPLHYEPASYLAAGLTILCIGFNTHHHELMVHAERDWIFALMISALAFGALMNARFFFARTKIYMINRQLVELAFTDGLTKINNRRALIAEWDRLIAKNPNVAINLLMIDVDDFKSINDIYGHDVGDDVLRDIAAILEAIKGLNICGRLGGEEFAVIHQGSSKEAEELADEINRRMSNSLVRELRFTVSIGIASHCPSDSIGAVMRRADEALYEAKRRGKNTFCVHGSPLPSSDQSIGETL